MNAEQRALMDEVLDATRMLEDAEADDMLVGAVDLHVHPGPSPFPRRISIKDAAVDAAGAGFRAIVAKSHHLPMQTDVLATLATGTVPDGIQVFGGVALNDSVGGLNPWVVDVVLKLGGRVVWFPTISSPAHIEHHRHHDSFFPKSDAPLRDNTEISVLGENGALKPEVFEILDLMIEHEAILNCGHLPASEIDVLIPAASRRGVQRILVSHPEFIVGAGPEDIARWTRYGAHVEHVTAMLISPYTDEDPIDTLARYRAAGVGVENTVISSDQGQQRVPMPVTGFRMLVRRLIDAGYSETDIRRLVGGNAGQLLGL